MTLPSNTYQCGVIQTHDSQNMANVICVTAPSATTELAVSTVVAAAWIHASSFRDAQVQDVTYKEIQCRRLDTGGATVVTPWATLSATGAGAVVGAPVDPGSCLGYTLRTATGGKSFRGRLYLGGVGRGALSSFSTQWNFGTSPGSVFKLCADQFLAQLLAGTPSLTWCVHSRKLAIATPVASITARTSILSQNPRARRYGVV
jgi:hypothetical protein